MVHPDGWEVRLTPSDTGTSVVAVDPHTRMGLSIQPLYDSEGTPLTMLVVGSYYPLGFLPAFTDDFKRGLEAEAAADLGPAYTVSATYAKMASSEAIELMITKQQRSPHPKLDDRPGQEETSVSLFNKLFGGSQERSKSRMSLDQAREIAGAYGEVL
jgi:hypothetical protein